MPFVSEKQKEAMSFAKLGILILAVCLLTSCSQSSKSAEVKSGEIFISECGYGYSQKPSSITLTCADGGIYLDNISYNSWNSNGATGKGIFNENTCDPDCATGKFSRVPVSITIVKPFKDANGKFIFSKMVLKSSSILLKGMKTANFDIGTQPETQANQEGQSQDSLVSPQSGSGTGDSSSGPPSVTKEFSSVSDGIDNLLSRLNSAEKLWSRNDRMNTPYGKASAASLGLKKFPDTVIECDLSYSGTWLFIYSNEDAAIIAANSAYFTREDYYDVTFYFDPVTQYSVLLHTSMGGNDQCINSALKIIKEIPTSYD